MGSVNIADKQFYRVRDICSIFGISRWTVLRWVKLGIMPQGSRLGSNPANQHFWHKGTIDGQVERIKRKAQAQMEA